MDTSSPLEEYVVLFDGVCNLCNASVQFIIRHDPPGRFKFAALQSDTGQKHLRRFGLDTGNFRSFILVTPSHVYQQSDAALEVARRLSGVWPCMYIFKIVPRFLRDAVYQWISRNRYRFFGRRNECMIPTPELKSRFVA